MALTLLSTRYGNVRTLEAKKSQNRFYQREANILAQDMSRMAAVFHKIESEATARGMPELAKFVRMNLQAHLQTWQHAMAEMQAQLSREIFRIREVESSHKHLARLDLLMRQQPSWLGFELDPSARIPDFLLAARLPDFAPQIEPQDTDHQFVEAMVKEVAALPPQPVEPQPKEFKRFKRVVDERPVKKSPMPRLRWTGWPVPRSARPTSSRWLNGARPTTLPRPCSPISGWALPFWHCGSRNTGLRWFPAPRALVSGSGTGSTMRWFTRPRLPGLRRYEPAAGDVPEAADRDGAAVSALQRDRRISAQCRGHREGAGEEGGLHPERLCGGAQSAQGAEL